MKVEMDTAAPSLKQGIGSTILSLAKIKSRQAEIKYQSMVFQSVASTRSLEQVVTSALTTPEINTLRKRLN
jgi:hypothetical protein